MFLTRILKSSVKLFKKDVICFVTVRRFDLGITKENLCYLSLKPTATTAALRQKIWHLLDLPDYCDEVIILKSHDDVEIPLTALRIENDLQHPYILEVWPPGKPYQNNLKNNMLTMGDNDNLTTSNLASINDTYYEKLQRDRLHEYYSKNVHSTVSNESFGCINPSTTENTRILKKILRRDFSKPNVTCKISSTTIISKLQGKKCRDNYASILLKIQNELNDLTAKMSKLENRIPL